MKAKTIMEKIFTSPLTGIILLIGAVAIATFLLGVDTTEATEDISKWDIAVRVFIIVSAIVASLIICQKYIPFTKNSLPKK